jgi:hypothetical protein
MDVFYYWKDFAEDLKADRIGRFRSSKEKLTQMQEGFPDSVWVFKTPRGKKGQLQLLARLHWTSKPPSGFRPGPGESHFYYDENDPSSVCFDGADREETLTAVSLWARTHFPAAVSANFQGQNGQHEMRGSVLFQLQQIARTLETRPFIELIGA